MLLPAATSTFSKEDTSFPLCSANESASGGELRIKHSCDKNAYFFIKEVGG
jgi:hypothetical protein